MDRQPEKALEAINGSRTTVLPSALGALGPDEGGFSVIGRLWNGAGPYLYGPLWVDPGREQI